MVPEAINPAKKLAVHARRKGWGGVGGSGGGDVYREGLGRVVPGSRA